MRLLAFVVACFALGCSESAKDLTVWQQRMREGNAETIEAVESVATKTDEAIGILRDNTTALAAIKSQIDALQVVSNPNGKDGDPESAPESPAKANDTPNPLKVATPGTSSESLTELATRLYGQGVSVHMKTEEQLRAIDAQLNGGAPVTGAIFQNQRTSTVTSQRSAVRLVPRGKGVVRWQRNSAGQTCGPNGCY